MALTVGHSASILLLYSVPVNRPSVLFRSLGKYKNALRYSRALGTRLVKGV